MRAILLDREGAWVSECSVYEKQLNEDPQRLKIANNEDFYRLPIVHQGFYDSHMHPTWMAKLKTQIDCRSKKLSSLVEEIVKRPEEKLFGFGWDEKSLDANYNEIEAAFKAIKKHIVLFRVCGHVAYISGKGFLKEKELESVERPRLDEKTFLKTLSDLKSLGLDTWSELLLRKEDHEITSNKGGLLFANVSDFSYFKNNSANVTYIKYFLDGSLGARTAWLSQPYSDDPSIGLQQWSDSDLRSSIEQSLDHGFLVAFHAIGDAALDQLLRVTTPLLYKLKKNTQKDFLHRIEHLQVCRDDQIDLISQQKIWSLGLQPSHRIADKDFSLERLGAERLQKLAYRLKSFIDANIPISLGSDAPIVSCDPQKTFQAIEDDSRKREKILLSETYKLFCIEGRQNAGIPAKKLLKNSPVYVSNL